MRFGLIGTGFWARTVHGPGVRDHPGSELAGVWGRDPDRADAASAALGVRRYAELDTMLREVDAVAIAIAPDIQAQLAVRAAQHGCHLLLDKPVALDLAAADGRAAAVVNVHCSHGEPGAAPRCCIRTGTSPGSWTGWPPSRTAAGPAPRCAG